MKHILTGIRAGVICALALTLWSFLGASETMGDADTINGAYYVASAYGLLGLPQIVYGVVIGALVVAWQARFDEKVRERLVEYDVDRRVAAALVSAPIFAAGIGAGVGGLHLAVTSSFQRDSFQALGLGLGAAALAAGAFVLAPLVIGPLSSLIGRLFPKREERPRVPRATLTVLGMYAIGLIGGLIMAYQYATSLQVWSETLVRTGFAALLVTPALFGLMSRFDIERLAWRWGIPIAGATAAIICFVGASSWTSATSEMRAAVTGDKSLFSTTTQALQPLADRDGDGYASGFGGIDCDDTDPDVYPGASEVAGDGVDQNCSGSDAPPPSAEDHPSRKVVSRAIDAGKNRATQKAEDIPDPPPNLVFILVDTLRQDHLGYAGYERDTSPNIDAIADESVAFMDTYAPSPHTPRSIPPLFFSRYPSRMQWLGAQYNYPKILPENLSVFEVLEEEGYYNVGMSSHFYFKEKMGIQQGFETWDNEGAKSIAESNDDIAAPRIWEKVEPTIEDLSERWHDEREPFALFVHLFEPHARWIGHDEFDFGDGDTQRERHINNYDSEIAFVDDYVGRIVDKLEEEDLYDESIFVLTSDHGEAFDEHGQYFHGQNLYNEVINVPLLIRVPGWFSRQVDGPVSLIDVPPTLLELFDMSIPAEFEGESLVEVMLGHADVPNRPVFAELLPYTNWKEKHQAIIEGDDKFIEVVTSGVEEMYDLDKDPGEQENIRDQREERAEELKERLYQFMQGQ